jgi:hypothetical protein
VLSYLKKKVYYKKLVYPSKQIRPVNVGLMS